MYLKEICFALTEDEGLELFAEELETVHTLDDLKFALIHHTVLSLNTMDRMDLFDICHAMTEDDVLEAFADSLENVETRDDLKNLIIEHTCFVINGV